MCTVTESTCKQVSTVDFVSFTKEEIAAGRSGLCQAEHKLSRNGKVAALRNPISLPEIAFYGGVRSDEQWWSSKETSTPSQPQYRDAETLKVNDDQ